MSDRLKQIVTSGLAFGALAIPGFAGFVAALGGDAQVMQAVVGAYAVYHILRLAVDYLHAKATLLVWMVLPPALALLIPAGASAQTPDPEPVEGQHGAVYVSYGYTVGSSLSLDNLQFDVDLAVPGTVLSFTGHFTDQTGVHVGPSAGYQVGPITVFGRHLFLVGADDAAAAAIGNKTGGGIAVPLPKGAVLRLSIHNHQLGGDGVDELTVGIGARF